MSAAVVPEDFIRLKYRQPLHQLKFDDVTENKALSMAQKKAPPKEDMSEEFAKMRFKPAIMYPAHTQNVRKEIIIRSDEVLYRQEHQPTLFEKVAITKQITKQRLREEKMREEMERIRYEKRMKMARKKASGGGDDSDDSDNEKDGTRAKAKRAKATAAAQQEVEDGEEGNGRPGTAATQKTTQTTQTEQTDATGKTQGDEDEDEDDLENKFDTQDMDEVEVFELKRAQLEKKERRILGTRASYTYHFPLKIWEKRMQAWKTWLRLNGSKKGTVSEMMPWIHIGDDVSCQDQYTLIQSGVTHILNVSAEVKNHYPAQFVYLKVPLKDDEDADISQYFPQVLSFFARVEQKRGKLFIHDSNSVSRSPAMLLAYLVADWKLTLQDAYNYVCLRRPNATVYDHYKHQLALLELEEGKKKGMSSVIHHMDFRFYEWNTKKGDLDPKKDYLEPEGTYSTAFKLYSKRQEEDHF